MKNVVKAVKKLKFWSRKRRKKKTHEPPCYPPPPPPCHYCCSCSSPSSSSSSSSSTRPSAPPLPPWLEADQNYGTFLAPSCEPIPEVTYSSQAQVQAPPGEIIMDPNPVFPTVSVRSRSSSSYQQYMVPEPVYSMPVTQTARRERSTGQFGCIFSFGVHLFRCLFPCFHIREVV